MKTRRLTIKLRDDSTFNDKDERNSTIGGGNCVTSRHFAFPETELKNNWLCPQVPDKCYYKLGYKGTCWGRDKTVRIHCSVHQNNV